MLALGEALRHVNSTRPLIVMHLDDVPAVELDYLHRASIRTIQVLPGRSSLSALRVGLLQSSGRLTVAIDCPPVSFGDAGLGALLVGRDFPRTE